MKSHYYQDNPIHDCFFILHKPEKLCFFEFRLGFGHIQPNLLLINLRRQIFPLYSRLVLKHEGKLLRNTLQPDLDTLVSFICGFPQTADAAIFKMFYSKPSRPPLVLYIKRNY